MTTIVNMNRSGNAGPGCLVQVAWFVFVGWWLSAAAVSVAWLCMMTVIGMPLGILIINKMPKLVALREPGQVGVQVVRVGDTTVVDVGARPKQRPFLVRAIYFILVGWWFSFVWMTAAWLLCITILGMPAGFWMFDKAPLLATLLRES